MADDLADLFPPAPAELSIGGQAVALKPLTLRELPAATEALKGSGLLGAWNGDQLSLDYRAALLGEGRANFVALLSVLARVDADTVEGWAIAEIKAAFDALVLVNIDFFVLAVAPLAEAPAAAATGDTRSSDSAPQDTASSKSATTA